MKRLLSGVLIELSMAVREGRILFMETVERRDVLRDVLIDVLIDVLRDVLIDVLRDVLIDVLIDVI
jgi:hypothetical protein